MNRAEFEKYILDTYAAEADNPWLEWPGHTVFRHPVNRKWFALTMVLTRDKLGLDGDGAIHAVNLKGDPLMIDAMRREPGFFSAYHMNKTHWITAALDGSADEEKLKLMLDMSFDLTRPKMRRRKAE